MIEFFKQALIFLCKEIKQCFFPPNCLLCGKPEQDYLCASCYTKLKQDTVFCIENIKKKQGFYFEKHFYLFFYQGMAKKLLTQFKFGEKSYFAILFAKIMIKNEKLCGFLKKYDIIMPVPIHKKRKAQRGYNQSELICTELVRIIKENKIGTIFLEKNCLQKVKHNLPQSSLNRKERVENVKQVYSLRHPERIKGKNIILVDDIYTTGSTVNACAKILKENGAKTIIVVTIAKD